MEINTDVSLDSSVPPTVEAGSDTPLTDKIKFADLTPEMQLDHAIEIAKVQQKALNTLVKYDLKNMLDMLTAPNVDGNKQARIKQAIINSVLVAMDYGVNVANIKMAEKGVWAKYEGTTAAHLAKLKENGMIIIAHTFKKEDDKQKISVGGNDVEENGSENLQNADQKSGEVNEEGQTSSQSETINQEGVLTNG